MVGFVCGWNDASVTEGVRMLLRVGKCLLHHDQEHLGSFGCAKGMGNIGWHTHDLSGVDADRRAADGEFEFSFEHQDMRVEGSGMLRDSFTCIEREDRECSSSGFCERSTHDCSLRIGYAV